MARRRETQCGGSAGEIIGIQQFETQSELQPGSGGCGTTLRFGKEVVNDEDECNSATQWKEVETRCASPPDASLLHFSRRPIPR